MDRRIIGRYNIEKDRSLSFLSSSSSSSINIKRKSFVINFSNDDHEKRFIFCSEDQCISIFNLNKFFLEVRINHSEVIMGLEVLLRKTSDGKGDELKVFFSDIFGVIYCYSVLTEEYVKTKMMFKEVQTEDKELEKKNVDPKIQSTSELSRMESKKIERVVEMHDEGHVRLCDFLIFEEKKYIIGALQSYGEVRCCKNYGESDGKKELKTIYKHMNENFSSKIFSNLWRLETDKECFVFGASFPNFLIVVNMSDFSIRGYPCKAPVLRVGSFTKEHTGDEMLVCSCSDSSVMLYSEKDGSSMKIFSGTVHSLLKVSEDFFFLGEAGGNIVSINMKNGEVFREFLREKDPKNTIYTFCMVENVGNSEEFEFIAKTMGGEVAVFRYDAKEGGKENEIEIFNWLKLPKYGNNEELYVEEFLCVEFADGITRILIRAAFSNKILVVNSNTSEVESEIESESPLSPGLAYSSKLKMLVFSDSGTHLNIYKMKRKKFSKFNRYQITQLKYQIRHLEICGKDIFGIVGRNDDNGFVHVVNFKAKKKNRNPKIIKNFDHDFNEERVIITSNKFIVPITVPNAIVFGGIYSPKAKAQQNEKMKTRGNVRMYKMDTTTYKFDMFKDDSLTTSSGHVKFVCSFLSRGNKEVIVCSQDSKWIFWSTTKEVMKIIGNRPDIRGFIHKNWKYGIFNSFYGLYLFNLKKLEIEELIFRSKTSLEFGKLITISVEEEVEEVLKEFRFANYDKGKKEVSINSLVKKKDENKTNESNEKTKSPTGDYGYLSSLGNAVSPATSFLNVDVQTFLKKDNEKIEEEVEGEEADKPSLKGIEVTPDNVNRPKKKKSFEMENFHAFTGNMRLIDIVCVKYESDKVDRFFITVSGHKSVFILNSISRKIETKIAVSNMVRSKLFLPNALFVMKNANNQVVLVVSGNEGRICVLRKSKSSQQWSLFNEVNVDVPNCYISNMMILRDSMLVAKVEYLGGRKGRIVCTQDYKSERNVRLLFEHVSSITSNVLSMETNSKVIVFAGYQNIIFKINTESLQLEKFDSRSKVVFISSVVYSPQSNSIEGNENLICSHVDPERFIRSITIWSIKGVRMKTLKCQEAMLHFCKLSDELVMMGGYCSIYSLNLENHELNKAIDNVHGGNFELNPSDNWSASLIGKFYGITENEFGSIGSNMEVNRYYPLLPPKYDISIEKNINYKEASGKFFDSYYYSKDAKCFEFSCDPNTKRLVLCQKDHIFVINLETEELESHFKHKEENDEIQSVHIHNHQLIVHNNKYVSFYKESGASFEVKCFRDIKIAYLCRDLLVVDENMIVYRDSKGDVFFRDLNKRDNENTLQEDHEYIYDYSKNRYSEIKSNIVFLKSEPQKIVFGGTCLYKASLSEENIKTHSFNLIKYNEYKPETDYRYSYIYRIESVIPKYSKHVEILIISRVGGDDNLNVIQFWLTSGSCIKEIFNEGYRFMYSLLTVEEDLILMGGIKEKLFKIDPLRFKVDKKVEYDIGGYVRSMCVISDWEKDEKKIAVVGGKDHLLKIVKIARNVETMKKGMSIQSEFENTIENHLRKNEMQMKKRIGEEMKKKREEFERKKREEEEMKRKEKEMEEVKKRELEMRKRDLEMKKAAFNSMEAPKTGNPQIDNLLRYIHMQKKSEVLNVQRNEGKADEKIKVILNYPKSGVFSLVDENTISEWRNCINRSYRGPGEPQAPENLRSTIPTNEQEIRENAKYPLNNKEENYAIQVFRLITLGDIVHRNEKLNEMYVSELSVIGRKLELKGKMFQYRMLNVLHRVGYWGGSRRIIEVKWARAGNIGGWRA